MRFEDIFLLHSLFGYKQVPGMQNISEAHRELSSFVKRPSESGRGL